MSPISHHLILLIILLTSSQIFIESQAKKNLDEICRNFPIDMNPRIKRAIPGFEKVRNEVLDYACRDGSILSCFVTLVRIAPTRFYVNINNLINDITGRSGPTLLQRQKLGRVKDEIKLLEAKIEAKKYVANAELHNLKLKERILELQILKVFTVICRHHYKNTREKSHQFSNTEITSNKEQQNMN